VKDTADVRDALRTLITREVRAAQRAIEVYPDEASLWQSVAGMPNTGGTLALHIAGNLRHFFGATLTHDGYKRNRDAEFAARNVPRDELLAGLDAAIESVERTLEKLPEQALAETYPERIANAHVQTMTWLMHLVSHTAYHLGQLDYHRRAVTGNVAGVDAVSVRELPKIDA
jgi:uncharacterized damage-inducible protein DinB